jgi:hypothetical protein
MNLQLATIAVGIVLLFAASGRQQVSAPIPILPLAPGTFGIGRVAYEWIDRNRLDPFSKDPEARRSLMVYVWYPTTLGQEKAAGVYLPGAAEIDRTPGSERIKQFFGRSWQSIVAGSIRSHALERAAAAKSPRRFPVVLFSHGDGVNSFSYTSLIEGLVSHGYVVAGVEHTYSSAAVVFPDGRVIQSTQRPILRGDRPPAVPYFEGVQIAMADMRRLTEIQAADLTFVLDQLGRANASDMSAPFLGRLDLGRIAAVGHSAGGWAAVRACQRALRIQVCVNQDGGSADGAFLRYIDAKPLSQPFLYVAAGTSSRTFTDQQLSERGISRDEWLQNAKTVADAEEHQLRSGKRGSYKVELTAQGVTHLSFSDVPLLNADNAEALARATRHLDLIGQVTRSFLDKFLKGEERTLLDEAMPDHSEIRIRRFGPLEREP